MSLVSTAQFLDFFTTPSSSNTPGYQYQFLDTTSDKDVNNLSDDNNSVITIEVSAPEPEQPIEINDINHLNNEEMDKEADIEIDAPAEITFVLDKIPGAECQDIIEVDEPAEIEVTEPSTDIVEVVETDPWDWQSLGLSKFLDWVYERMNNVPRHSGKDTTGLERAISYFEAIDREISKAMRQDYKNEIDSAKAEEARAAIEDGLERLRNRLEEVRAKKFKKNQKKNKKAFYENVNFIKEAQKVTNISGIVITIPLLISRLARICINGAVSHGKNIEDSYEILSKKYKLNMRERAELMQLLEDMGYPIYRPRDLELDEEFDPTSHNNIDWQVNYQS